MGATVPSICNCTDIYSYQNMYKLIHAIISASFIRHATIIRTSSSGITRMTIANVDCEEAFREFDTAISQSRAFIFNTES